MDDRELEGKIKNNAVWEVEYSISADAGLRRAARSPPLRADLSSELWKPMTRST